MKLNKITAFGEIEEYKGNLTFVVDARITMSSDGKKLFEAEEYKVKKSFSAYAIIEDKEQKKGIQQILDYLVEKHLDGELPDDPDYIAIKKGDDCTYSKGDNKGEIYEGFEGNMAIKLKRPESFEAPEVYSEQGDLIEKYPDKRVYPDGANVRIQVVIRAYDGEYTGIGANFDAVIYTDKGERIVSKAGNRVDKKKLFGNHDTDKGVDSRDEVFGKKKGKKDKSEKKSKKDKKKNK